MNIKYILLPIALFFMYKFITKNRKISASGLASLKSLEGLELFAYKDIGGVLTIGYGHTGSDVLPVSKIDEKQATDLLLKDLLRFENAVNQLVSVPITQGQFDALVIFSFNVGIEAFKKSTLLKVLNEGNYLEATNQLARWNKVKGQVVSGLTKRRETEQKIFWS